MCAPCVLTLPSQVNVLAQNTHLQLLASGGEDGLVEIWDLRTNKRVGAFSLPACLPEAGVGGVLFGIAVAIGLIDSPFPESPGGVVTPAARRVQQSAPASSKDAPQLKAVQLNDDPF